MNKKQSRSGSSKNILSNPVYHIKAKSVSNFFQIYLNVCYSDSSLAYYVY